jgi:chromate transporter
MTPSLPELTRVSARIGLLSFGGPAAQIALMHREIVDERQWVTEKEYLSALSFCMLLPGPEAMQLATWIGWRTHGTRGGLIAGGLFVLPGAIVVLALSVIYAAWGQLPLVAALFTGVQAAVLAVVTEALLRVSKRALKTRLHWIIALTAFAALFFLALPFPLIILAAGLWGFVTSKGPAVPSTAPAPWRQSGRAITIWGAVWLLPLAALQVLTPGILAELALFFSKLALLTFGGAYAVLTWMAQEVVQQKQWLTLTQMMDGLGLAETTPGPLILVTEFVGYLAAFKAGGVWMGLAGAAITLWMTFAPCFLWIFAGAPWIARLTAAPRLAGALAAITAAVVGVIANLSLWFAAHVLFAQITTTTYGHLHLLTPDLGTLKPLATALALLAAVLLLKRHWPLPWVLAICAGVSAAVAAF